MWSGCSTWSFPPRRSSRSTTNTGSRRAATSTAPCSRNMSRAQVGAGRARSVERNSRPSCLPMREWSSNPKSRRLNELYASKGYPFANEAVARRYYGGNPRFRKVDLGDQSAWVRDASPIAAFSPSWFSSSNADSITEWTRLIANGRNAGSGAAKAEAAALATAELPLPAEQSASGAAAQPEPVMVAAGAPSAAEKELASKAEPVELASASKEATSATGSGASSNSPANVQAGGGRCGCRASGRSHPDSFEWLFVGLVALALSRRARSRSALL